MTTQPVEILLVEDNFDDAELTIRELKKHNMANQLVHVKDGEEALDFLFARGAYKGRDNHPYPKVVLLDIQMPKLNGLEVLEQLKKNQETKAIPVVMLTSSAENPDIQRCYDLGANSYIVKPVNFEGFAESIRSLGFYWLLLNQPPIS
ncbi:MAG: response regulator [Chitinophagaceae bacterium]|nr:response regulator [Chitinophagaceae bacterium]MBN8666284.1 response regulator [Chitinophagales bacterium]